jgi:hypothetical protein
VNTADIATPGDLPEDQAESVHIGSLERIEVIHVYHLFKNLKAESICAFQRTASVTERRPNCPRNIFLIAIICFLYYIVNVC